MLLYLQFFLANYSFSKLSIFERFIQLGKHVKIAINISITVFCVLWDVLLLLSESIVEIIVFIGSIFERFIQLGKHVKIAINIRITGVLWDVLLLLSESIVEIIVSIYKY